MTKKKKIIIILVVTLVILLVSLLSISSIKEKESKRKSVKVNKIEKKEFPKEKEELYSCKINKSNEVSIYKSIMKANEEVKNVNKVKLAINKKTANTEESVEEMTVEKVASNEVKDELKEEKEVLKEQEIKEEVSNKDKEEKEEQEKVIDIKENETYEKEENIPIKIVEHIEEPKSLKNGFYTENNVTYYYENDTLVTGKKLIDGKYHYFNSNGKYLGINNVKVIDVSHHQGFINWDTFLNESDCYGVILRIGYYNTMDKEFKRNISELKRLNIPYGIYIFSYATTLNGAITEANFTNKIINEFNLTPTLGIYYDIESFKTNTTSSDNITKAKYDQIIGTFINKVNENVLGKYNVGVYSGRWYAMNRLSVNSKKYVSWVAEYNNTCKYDGTYNLWQYTSKGRVPGINGNVDISFIIN